MQGTESFGLYGTRGLLDPVPCPDPVPSPMPTTTYAVRGMHCAGCETKIRAAVESMPGVTDVRPSASGGAVTIDSDAPIDRELLASAIANAGDYTLGEPVESPPAAPGASDHADQQSMPGSSTGATGYPALAILVAYILGASLFAELPRPGLEAVMSNFMGGFFLAFSFFKFLDLRGFASGFARYDIIAAKWKPWGYLYPFVELVLGIAYITRFEPTLTHTVTIVVLTAGGVGVIRSMMRKDRIKCACLGTVIDLPLGTVTLIEDLGMALMAAAMLVLHFAG